MRVRSLIMVPFIALCLLLPSLAFGADGPVKIGSITAFTGEVLARTQGVWVKVKAVPYPVFSDDKVVTRRGRAEISLADGGLMRLDLDSNISIEQVEEKEGFAFKNKVSTRQVNLMVGKVWFSVKTEKGNKFNVRTPTMTAAVRGSAATITQDINPNLPAEYAFIEGHIEPSGSYQPAPPKAVEWSDIRTNAADLPSSNPAVDSSPVQQSAVEATDVRSKALQAASRADEESEVAKAAGDQAEKSQADSDKLQAAAKEAKANKGKGEAAVLDKKAAMLAEQEKILEAQTFKDVGKVNKVQNTIGQLGKEVTKLEAMTKELEDISKEVDEAAKSGDLNKAKKAIQKSKAIVTKVPKPTLPPAGTTGGEVIVPTTEPTQEMGYTEGEPTDTVIPPATQTLPDTKDLGTSSPAM